ncbi:hypothetical protein KSF_014620 [Reticulibacter mediterranei]|uniref:ABC transporter domain-containing protein n=1 Tax=Reticulibacter mediterranei TaxID=2778369 RepID=A0A8J3IHI5_9CHLR|nr:ABC transporter ATP-binding protein [Reticulibacter mediterranei]GHO91414.1 hypothetical protein KSF_014620 [Reticulibacter mediterranei]
MTTPSDNLSHSIEDQSPAIEVRNLSFRYGVPDEEQESPKGSEEAGPHLPAIEDISFSLPAGELMLIAGPSGCGKSTLLKCLNGLIPRSYPGVVSGEINLEGRSITNLTLRDLAQHVGTMLQDPDKQILGSTIEQEIAFGMENLCVPRKEMIRQIQEVLQRLHLEKYQKRATHALSGDRGNR